MKKIVIPVSDALKAKLDEKRAEGYTINGYIRAILEKELAHVRPAKDSRGKRRGERSPR